MLQFPLTTNFSGVNFGISYQIWRSDQLLIRRDIPACRASAAVSQPHWMENVLYSIWPGDLHESNRDVYVDLLVTDE